MNAEMIRKAGYGLLLGCLTLVSVSCGCRVVIGDLRCEYQVSPLCVDTPSPRFTWAYAGGEEFMQAACRLCVATEPGKLDDPDIWDSGKIVAERPLAVMPDTGALKSRTVYWWRVEAWNEAGERFVSPVATFETALLESSEWQARWITDSCGRDCVPAPMFRRSFPVKEGAVRARLYASAAAYGKFSLNGEPVSDNRLDPGYTHYDRRNLYAVHDVTPLLREGENVLAAVLGNGFYNALQPLSVWNFENARWRNRARMLCELHIDYADGGHEVVCSDSSWRTSADGPYLSNDIYSGDTYDARREIPGWDRPGFDDGAWAQAVEVEAPSPRLKAQAMPPIRATRELAVRPGTQGNRMRVLQHEAFHQYLFQAWPNCNSSPWFNEGSAEFFGSFEYRSNRWTLTEERVVVNGLEALARNRDVDWEELLRTFLLWDYPSFYNPQAHIARGTAFSYAFSYGLMHFLYRGAPALRNRPYRDILPTYLETLEATRDPVEASIRAFKLDGNGDYLKSFARDFREYWTRSSERTRAARQPIPGT